MAFPDGPHPAPSAIMEQLSCRALSLSLTPSMLCVLASQNQDTLPAPFPESVTALGLQSLPKLLGRKLWALKNLKEKPLREASSIV